MVQWKVLETASRASISSVLVCRARPSRTRSANSTSRLGAARDARISQRTTTRVFTDPRSSHDYQGTRIRPEFARVNANEPRGIRCDVRPLTLPLSRRIESLTISPRRESLFARGNRSHCSRDARNIDFLSQPQTARVVSLAELPESRARPFLLGGEQRSSITSFRFVGRPVG